MEFTTRAYNSFELNSKTKASIIKTSKEVRLLGEIEYYKSIPEDLQVYFPRMLKSSSENGLHQMELEYYAYENLGNVMIDQNYDRDFWSKVFDFIFSYIDTYKQSAFLPSRQSDLLSMFVDKTEKEYSDLINKFNFFNQFKDTKEFVLNGTVLKSFDVIWKKIKPYIESLKYDDKFYFIHGDLCFSNILYGVNNITKDVILKFIDPRGIFGKTKFFGDFYYDLAKISHSCSGGYEFYIYDRFDVSNIDNRFILSYHNAERKNSINEKFLSIVEQYNFDYTKIKLIEGLIFIGMCARHYDSLNRQKSMLMTGLDILNEIYENL
jgi:hypothetical protein